MCHDHGFSEKVAISGYDSPSSWAHHWDSGIGLAFRVCCIAAFIVTHLRLLILLTFNTVITSRAVALRIRLPLLVLGLGSWVSILILHWD